MGVTSEPYDIAGKTYLVPHKVAYAIICGTRVRSVDFSKPVADIVGFNYYVAEATLGTLENSGDEKKEED